MKEDEGFAIERQNLKRSTWEVSNESAEGHTDKELAEREQKAKEAVRESLRRQRAIKHQMDVPDTEQSKRCGWTMPLREAHPALRGCRSVHSFERLNHIEEGTYGVVYRARDRQTGEIVALKKLKMDRELNGFPITSLREIRTLMEAAHENVVSVREIVVGDTLSQVYIVMEFIEHDLKTLLTMQRMPFLASEVKTLMRQLLGAMSLLHRNWIIHRDLKTSNLLMNNRGQIKLADFGLARTYGEPRKGDLTALVVTLWYRAPELLMGATEYDTAIDIWSVGCIFAELIMRKPLFAGKNEIDQLTKIFRLLGQPNETSWPGFGSLPNAKALTRVAQPYSALRQSLRHSTDHCIDLLHRLLTYDPAKRITADEALLHPYFAEAPAPAHPSTFGSFPSIAAGEKKRIASPEAPHQVIDRKPEYQLELEF
jgi:cell division cycle 2-like protein